MKHICIADVASLTHVVLEILPAAGRRKTCDDQQQHIPDEAATEVTAAPSRHTSQIQTRQESRLITVMSEALIILLQNPEQSQDCHSRNWAAVSYTIVKRHHFMNVCHP